MSSPDVSDVIASDGHQHREGEICSDCPEVENNMPSAERHSGDTTKSDNENDHSLSPQEEGIEPRVSTPPTQPVEPKDPAADLLAEARELREKARALEKSAKSQRQKYIDTSDTSDSGSSGSKQRWRLNRERSNYGGSPFHIASPTRFIPRPTGFWADDEKVIGWNQFRKRKELTYGKMDYPSDSSTSSRDLHHIRRKMEETANNNKRRFMRLCEKHAAHRDRKQRKFRRAVMEECDRLERMARERGSGDEKSDGHYELDTNRVHINYEAQEQHEQNFTREPLLTPKISLMPWNIFRPRLNKKRRGETFVIDVLMGEPDIRPYSGFQYSVRIRDVQDDRGHLAQAGAPDKDQKHGDKTDSDLPAHASRFDGQSPLPERIRINSKQLIRILDVIHKSRVRDEYKSVFNEDTVILLRPFRMLEYYDAAIREWSEKLDAGLREAADKDLLKAEGSNHEPGNADHPGEETDVEATRAPREHGQDDTAAVVQEEEGADEVGQKGKNDEEENEFSENEDEEDDEPYGDGEGHEGQEEDLDEDGLSRSPIALQHCRCLLDFTSEYIKRRVAYLQSPRCERIVYSDLWYLFKPGDIALSAGGRQAYQILSLASTPHVGKIRQPTRYKEPEESEKEYTKIECSYIHSDGASLGPVSQTFTILKFNGEKVVSSLEIYPLRFHVLKKLHVEWSKTKKSGPELDLAMEKGVTNLRRYLIERGKMFVDVASVKHMFYSGLTVDRHDEIDSQVMIDFTQAFTTEEGKDWCPKITNLVGGPSGESGGSDASDDGKCNQTCCRGEYVHDDVYVQSKSREDFVNRMISGVEGDRDRQLTTALYPRSLKNIQEKKGSLTDEEYLIMSYCVFGFVLRDRTWAKLDMNYLQNISDSNATSLASDDNADSHKTSFDQLVLPQNHKSMVLSLVSQHFRNKASQDGITEQFDIVRGKGKGLIILLHGAPGVGKTTTAEGVAEKFKKPLFQLTCSDLGMTPSEVEGSLQRNFLLASRWDCILLLDEADVFLAGRRREDFNRNGLVAVFLRVLEYYSGILFLTTNRIGDFDEAFSSRIHMSLLYQPLDSIPTALVFTLNLDMIEARYKQRKRKIQIDTTEILTEVGTYWDKNEEARWNGRQIRNACQTALALAEFDAQPKGSEYDLTVSPETSKITVHLQVHHLKQVSQAYLEFIQYLRAVHGVDAETRANETGLRAVEAVFEAIKSGAKNRVVVHPGQANNLYNFNLKNVKNRAQQAQHAQQIQQAQQAHVSTSPSAGMPQPMAQPEMQYPPMYQLPTRPSQLQPQQYVPQQPSQQSYPPPPGYQMPYYGQEAPSAMGVIPMQGSGVRLSQGQDIAAQPPTVSVSGPLDYTQIGNPQPGVMPIQPTVPRQ